MRRRGRRGRRMAISDTVAGNLVRIYLGVIAAMKAYGLVTGRSFTGVFVLVASTAVVVLVFIASLAWDVWRKATCSNKSRDRRRPRRLCRGGICWHGATVRPPCYTVRVTVPRDQPHPIPTPI